MNEIISYSKFKNDYRFRRLTLNKQVELNMTMNKFIPTIVITPDKGEKTKDLIDLVINTYKLDNYIIVWYRGPGDCGIPYFEAFFKSKEVADD